MTAPQRAEGSEPTPPAEPRKASWQAGILTLGWILQALSEALVLLVVVRFLGKPDVGVLTALLLIYETVALTVGAGFPSALTYFLPARPDAERRAIAWRFAGTVLMLGAVACLVLLGLGTLDLVFPDLLSTFKESPDGRTVSLSYLFLLAPYPIFDMPTRLLPNLLVVEGRARAAAALGVVKTAGTAIFTLVPMALGYDLWVVVGGMVTWGLLRALLVPLALHVLYRGARVTRSPVGTREIFRFAIPLGLTDIVAILNNRFDRFLILSSFAVPFFAEYQAGSWQVPFIATIPYAVGSAYTPQFRALFVAGEARRAIDLWRASALKVALIVVPATMVFIVAAEETMAVLFTDDYLRAAGVFRWYSILTLLRIAAFGNVIVAAGRSDYVLQAILFAFVSNVVISIPLVWWVGFEGPAIGTAIAFVPTVAVYCWRMAAAAQVPFRTVFPLVGYLRILGLAGVASLGALAIKFGVVAPPGVLLVLEGLGLLGGFALLGTLSGTITRDDWRYLRDWMSGRMLR